MNKKTIKIISPFLINNNPSSFFERLEKEKSDGENYVDLLLDSYNTTKRLFEKKLENIGKWDGSEIMVKGFLDKCKVYLTVMNHCFNELEKNRDVFKDGSFLKREEEYLEEISKGFTGIEKVIIKNGYQIFRLSSMDYSAKA